MKEKERGTTRAEKGALCGLGSQRGLLGMGKLSSEGLELGISSSG